MELAKTTQEFIERVNKTAERGRVFIQYVGNDDGLGLFVEPDGSASACLFDDPVCSLPSGSTPEQILDMWSSAVRKFAAGDRNTVGTLTFIKDLKMGDLILDEHGFNAKVVYVLKDVRWDEMHVTTVSHGHPDGKQVKRFLQYSKNSMETVDLLWAEGGEVIVQEN